MKENLDSKSDELIYQEKNIQYYDTLVKTWCNISVVDMSLAFIVSFFMLFFVQCKYVTLLASAEMVVLTLAFSFSKNHLKSSINGSDKYLNILSGIDIIDYMLRFAILIMFVYGKVMS